MNKFSTSVKSAAVAAVLAAMASASATAGETTTQTECEGDQLVHDPLLCSGHASSLFPRRRDVGFRTNEKIFRDRLPRPGGWYGRRLDSPSRR